MSQISRRLLIAASGFSFIGVAPSAAHAQGFLLDLYAGVALPTGRLNDLTNAGFSGGLGLGYVFNRAVGIRADFAGEWLKGQDPVVSPLPDIDQAFFGRDVNLYHYDASIMINATDPRQTNWIVAIDAGAGATTIQFRGDELDRPDSETRFTIPVGLGVGYLVSETVGVFIRGRWYLMFTDVSRFGGSTWSSFPIWGGFGIRVG
jgi:hypothetical protein